MRNISTDFYIGNDLLSNHLIFIFDHFSHEAVVQCAVYDADSYVEFTIIRIEVYPLLTE